MILLSRFEYQEQRLWIARWALMMEYLRRQARAEDIMTVPKSSFHIDLGFSIHDHKLVLLDSRLERTNRVISRPGAVTWPH